MWHGILGHDDVVDRFHRILAAGRLASTYLFVGPPGVGKRRFAIELARSLLCTETPEASLEPCGRCESCQMFVTGTHPDLELVGLPPGKSTLPISLFVGDDEHRNQEGLCHRIGLRPFFGRRKVAIIDDADQFGIASANCLLKTLEEPPPSALLILIGTSPARQLPTIRSRSQIVRFRTLDTETIAKILLETGTVSDRAQALRAAEFGEGSVERARELADPILWEFRDQFMASLSSAQPDSVRLGRSVQAFVDDAGKEASLRRDRLRLVIGFAMEFYRLGLRTARPSGDIIRALDACVTALEQIDRNANLGLTIQHWCEKLVGFIGLCEQRRTTFRVAQPVA
ncbi:MAG TPA: DNA polymerase III subunit [Lacipirellulaceae bacterium]|nr:DNA polymerase III subunit [Lacipirellulaceae bacterium]